MTHARVLQAWRQRQQPLHPQMPRQPRLMPLSRPSRLRSRPQLPRLRLRKHRLLLLPPRTPPSLRRQFRPQWRLSRRQTRRQTTTSRAAAASPASARHSLLHLLFFSCGERSLLSVQCVIISFTLLLNVPRATMQRMARNSQQPGTSFVNQHSRRPICQLL